MKKADNEFKRAMNLIWKHKKYRKVFGLHPVIIGVCLLCAVLGGLLPLIGEWVGEVANDAEKYFSIVIPPFFYLIFFANFGTSFMVSASSGKSLFSFPGAKYLMVKGVLVFRAVIFGAMLLLTILMQLICVWTGASDKVVWDDLLILFCSAYVLGVIAAGIPMVGSFFAVILGVYGCINGFLGNTLFTVGLRNLMIKSYNNDMSWWLVAILVIVLLVGGTFLGMKLLERTYEKRRVAIPLEQRVAQQ